VYEQSSILKTSALFKLNLWLIEALFELDALRVREVEKAVELVAMGLQILNDLEAQDPNNPQFGNDLKEKKMSYPMIIFWERNKETDDFRQFVALFNGEFSPQSVQAMRALIDPAVVEATKRVDAIQKELEDFVASQLADIPAAQAFLMLFAHLKAKMSAK
jgi:geranylgeranyl pyrophosphate synthase